MSQPIFQVATTLKGVKRRVYRKTYEAVTLPPVDMKNELFESIALGLSGEPIGAEPQGEEEIYLGVKHGVFNPR